MTDEGTFCTTAQVQQKAGENASVTSNTEAFINDFVKQAEAYICSVTRFDWISAWGDLDAALRRILTESASNFAACYVIQFDMFGYTQIEEVEAMINFMMARFDINMALLRDQELQKFITKGE